MKNAIANILQRMEAIALCSTSVFTHSPHQLGKQINIVSSRNCLFNQITHFCQANQLAIDSSSPLEMDKPMVKHIPIYMNNKENVRPPSTVTNTAPIPAKARCYGGKAAGDETPRPKSIYTTPRRAGAPFCSPAIGSYRRPNSVERPPRTPAIAPAHEQQQHQFAQLQKRSNSTDRPSTSASGNSSPLPHSSPSTERMARIDTRDEPKSPGRLRQRLFSSLERKADRMKNLLTPKKIRSEAPTKLKCMKVSY